MTFPFFPTGMSAKTVREQALRHGIYPWTVSSGNAYARRLLGKGSAYRCPGAFRDHPMATSTSWRRSTGMSSA